MLWGRGGRQLVTCWGFSFQEIATCRLPLDLLAPVDVVEATRSESVYLSTGSITEIK